MIPVKLSLRNFMCYRDGVAPLNFQAFHMACLTGDNGHGKSALLEAMTWALWGGSRAKHEDELIHLRETDMAVEFEFDVPPNRYRVVRQRTRSTLKKPGKTDLSLSILSNGQCQPLSFGVRETEAKIKELLKLDYDTFINSAFLRQGKADEFTRKRAGERKEILASILNLSFYDELSEKAKEYRKEKEQEYSQILTRLESNKRELERKAEYLEQKGFLESSLKQVSLERDEIRTELEGEKDRKRELEIKESQAGGIEKTLKTLVKEEQDWIVQVGRHGERVAEFTTLINKKDQIEKSFQRYLLLKDQEKLLGDKLAQMTKLMDSRNQMERQIEREENELRNKGSHFLRTIKELENKIFMKPGLSEKAEELKGRTGIIQKQEEALAEKRKEQFICQEQVATYSSEHTRLNKLLQDTREKQALLGRGEDTCPLCGSSLGQEKLIRIEEHYQEEIQSAEISLKELEKKLRDYTGNLANLKPEIENLEKGLETKKRAYEREEGLLQKALQEIMEAESRLPREKQELENLARILTLGDFAWEPRLAVGKLDEEIKALNYDEAHHRNLKNELTSLEKFQREKFLLDEAEKNIEREKKEERQALEALEKKREQIEAEQAKLKGLKQELEVLPGIRVKVEELVVKLKNKEQEREDLLKKHTEIEVKLGKCREIEQENRRLEEEKAITEHERHIYQTLTEAFGKKGVQALIIENALPEIEYEASQLLARLTDERMHLSLEMEPESPGGKASEALEIKIADELGTRNYEMFSGGESFRIDFALRIALSKFLARRAGAPLSLLIVDEGFGSQDEMGKEKLIEALHAIRDDFDKILVITHLPELKEYFQYRINVKKTEAGSTFSLEPD